MSLDKRRDVRVTSDLPRETFYKLDDLARKTRVPKTRLILDAVRDKLRREQRRQKRSGSQ